MKIRILSERKIYLYSRFLFTRAKSALIFDESIAGFILRFIYRLKLLRWLKKHPSRGFNGLIRNNRGDLYRFVLEREGLREGIDYLEFGVAGGGSLSWWVENNKDPRSRFIGFDTFTGLPEDWDRVPRGAFTSEGKVPQIEDKRCNYQVGLFQDTLYGFLERFKLDRRTVVHIDCDLYSSTLFVLAALAPKLKKGDILIFDEFGSIRHPAHEFRAFSDFVSAFKFNYEAIGASNFCHQMAMKLV